jgi:hypothetical protein
MHRPLRLDRRAFTYAAASRPRPPARGVAILAVAPLRLPRLRRVGPELAAAHRAMALAKNAGQSRRV